MKFIGLLMCLATLLFSSCSVEIAMQVDKDNSGNMAFKVDMSQMFEMFGAFGDSISKEEMDSVVLEGGMEGFKEAFEEESVNKLKESGITNLSAGLEDGKYMVIRYDYADINRAYDFFFVLDTNLTAEQIKELKEVEYFKTGKDELVISFHEDGFKDAMKGGMGEDMPDMGEMEGMDMSFMTSMFNIKQSWEFERPIARIIDKNDLPIIVKGNKVYYSTNMTNYLEEFVGHSITIIFDDGKTDPPPTKKKRRK